MTGDVHVDHWGTFVTTPEVSVGLAGVKVSTQIVNTIHEVVNAQITVQVCNQSGKKVATASREVELAGGMVTAVEQRMELKNPLLWSPGLPVLSTPR